MKNILTSVLALMFTVGALQAQKQSDEYLGLPGDNLNLFAVMNLFQDSETLEAFERSLNDPERMINNLDLNGDGLVDYIMVNDYVEDNLHNIVLRVALNRNEFQDVAVFVVEKYRDGSVMVQLIGDEALYGPNYIIEPNYAETPNPGYRGNVKKQKTSSGRNVTVVNTNYYEVAHWPVIVYLGRPAYRPWRSAYYYGYYPAYWSPWTPHYWHFYYGYHYNWNTRYYAYYRPWNQPRTVHYRTVYYTRIRNYSPTVVVNVNKGVYKGTYSKPETRRQGEVLYSQRHPRGTTVPAERSAVNSNTNRTRQAPATSTQVSRPENKSGNGTVSNPRTGTTSRPTTPANQGQRTNVNTRNETRTQDTQKSGSTDTERVSRPERSSGTTTAPARTTTAPRQSNTNVQRPASQPERRQPAVSQPREKSNPAPARATERSSSGSNRQSTTVKPSSQESRSRDSRTSVKQSSSGSDRSSRTTTSSPSRSSSSGSEKRSSPPSRRQ